MQPFLYGFLLGLATAVVPSAIFMAVLVVRTPQLDESDGPAQL